MSKPLLIVGNKNYSSWSLRPYMALKKADIEFEEKLIRFGEPQFSKAVRRYSKAGLVPILIHKENVIWDSLAILEYVAETWPKKQLWPKNAEARAFARSMCAEMHSGFRALRSACPMNIRRPPQSVVMNDAILKDLARIEGLWTEAHKRFGAKGDFLFGKFTNADAMFAPVASRIETYKIPVGKISKSYIAAVLNSAAFTSWKAAALKEPWIYPEDEV